MAVLTQGREVSTSLRRIPATALSPARLPSQPELDLARPEKVCAHHFRDRSPQSQHAIQANSEAGGGAFLEFKMALLNYLARELQKVTHHNEIGGRGGWGGPAAGPALCP